MKNCVNILFTREEYENLIALMGQCPQNKRWFEVIEEQQEERNKLHNWNEIIIDGETVQYDIELYSRVYYSNNKICNLIIKFPVNSKLKTDRILKEIEKVTGSRMELRMEMGDQCLHREFDYYYYVVQVLVEAE